VTADSDDTSIRRPRLTPERELDLLNAAIDALCEVGYQDLSMDLVAAKARCSKATLYRLWPGKAQMIAAALYATRPVRPEEIDTGSLRGDLLTMAQLMGAGAQKGTALFAALGHAMLADADLDHVVQTSVVKPWFAELNGFVDRAVERGELPSRPPAADFLPELLLSVAVARPLFGSGLADADYLTRCVEQVLLPALLPAALHP
jgi:AcrR family transcriptional regulator